jgi:hypothetical protein
VIAPDGAGHDGFYETEAATMDEVTLIPGTRHAKGGALSIPLSQGAASIRFEPFLTFLMRGIGYGHPAWRHGGYKGDLVVEREDIDLGAVDMGSPENWHTLTLPGEAPQTGMGVFEQLIAGPYRPYGL